MELDEARRLLADLESERVERKASLSDKDRVCQAVCAYANDLPDSGQPGYVFIGANDDGSVAGLTVDERLLNELADMRSSGKMLPPPNLSVERLVLDGGAVAVVIVQPSLSPPVRYEGRVWIRVGARRAIATADEERRLAERRIAGDLLFDQRPIPAAGLGELDMSFFAAEYLRNAIGPEALKENQRTDAQRLSALRFATPDGQHPTNGGVLVLGIDPRAWVPGAYVQFVRFEGDDLSGSVLDHKEISGKLHEQSEWTHELLSLNVRTRATVGDAGKRLDAPDYPVAALREVVNNALMHRSYEATTAPVRVNWFSDRVEVQSPGGLFGRVTPESFGRDTDYRNPVLADAMKTLGLVERFGVGVQRVRRLLEENGNPEPQFEFEDAFVKVTVRPAG